jgi:hypothetical protein
MQNPHPSFSGNMFALSRRKQGFDSPRERQENQIVKSIISQLGPLIRKLYGKPAPERWRTLALAGA